MIEHSGTICARHKSRVSLSVRPSTLRVGLCSITLKSDFVGSRRLSVSPPYFALFLCVLGHKERRAYNST